MNRRIRRLGTALLACFVVLFVQLNVIQVGQQAKLMADTRNNRVTLRNFNRMRGQIITADGVVIARSVPSKAGDSVKYQREYPTGDLFGNITGYYTYNYGSTGLERTMDAVLMGDTTGQDVAAAGNLFKGTNEGTVRITLRYDVQKLAARLLGKRTGSIVVEDPNTGAIIAAVSYPRFDPNVLAVHDSELVGKRLAALNSAPGKPMLDRTYQERYMPGSSFKIVTTGIALQAGTISLDTDWPVERSFVPPLTKNPIHNYNNSWCGGTMAEVFYRSCNIPFARTALNVGAQGMVDGTKQWGIGERIPYDLPSPAASQFWSGSVASLNRALPLLAIGGFGQGNDAMVPMHMAMIASTVANDGDMMAPYTVAGTIAHDGTVLSQTRPRIWKRPINPSVAQTLTTLMIGVVNQGTGKKMKLANGVQAAAKTGTAQLTDSGPERSNVWIVGFAPVEAPRYTVQVMIKGGPNDAISASTGGTICGPVAKALLDYLLANT